MLLKESGIAPDIAAQRGYRTVRSRSELVGIFPKWQRRAPALFVPMFSPDGKTTRAQIRPDNPRTRRGKVVKYETALGDGLILDVHPSMMERVRDSSTSLLITEGVKTADAATSQGLCTIALSGVDCWQSKGTPLPCWEHVALEGRRVFVCFDSDCMTKYQVQGALRRLVAFLEDRGANVQVIYLPHTPDSNQTKQGIDDYLVAGGTVAEMMLLARPYDRQDLARVRLSRDEELRGALEVLWGDWRRMPAKTMGENTRRSVVRALTFESQRSGKVLPGGRVSVALDRRTLSEEAAASTRAVHRAIETLEDEGRLVRENAGRKPDKAGVITLIPQTAAGRAQGNQKEEGDLAGKRPLNLSHKGASDRGDYPARAPRATVPELRWSATLKHREYDKRGRPVEVYQYLGRLGKRCAALLEHLEERGGSAGIPELMGRFAGKRTRERDFKRRTLAMLAGWRYDRKERRWLSTGPPIITVEGDTVILVDSWQEALEHHRESTGEPEALERQRQRHALQRQAYRHRGETVADPVPEMRPIADLRTPWPAHPAGCACPPCVKRFGEPEGEHVAGCSCVDCFTAIKQEAHEAGRRVAPLAVRHTRPARESAARNGPRLVDGIYVHGPECDCDWCCEETA